MTDGLTRSHIPALPLAEKMCLSLRGSQRPSSTNCFSLSLGFPTSTKGKTKLRSWELGFWDFRKENTSTGWCTRALGGLVHRLRVGQPLQPLWGGATAAGGQGALRRGTLRTVGFSWCRGRPPPPVPSSGACDGPDSTPGTFLFMFSFRPKQPREGWGCCCPHFAETIEAQAD